MSAKPNNLPPTLPAGTVVFMRNGDGHIDLRVELTAPAHILSDEMVEAVRQQINFDEAHLISVHNDVIHRNLRAAFAHVLTPPVAKEPKTLAEQYDQRVAMMSDAAKNQISQPVFDSVRLCLSSLDAVLARLDKAGI